MEYTETRPTLSVLLPVFDAMPWLTFAVRDMLKQQLRGNASLELLVSFDGGGDNSLAFLLDLVSKLGPSRASDDVIASSPSPGPSDEANDATNPAMRQPMRAAEGVDHPSFSGAAAPPMQAPLSAGEVASAARPEHRLRLLRRADRSNRGQGAAMTLALRHARAELIAQMESDDERSDEHAFARMLALLEAHPEWDGVSCLVELIGWERPGMQAYASWQNGLVTAEQMAAGRFVEIPALHQTAVFKREAVEAVLASTDGCYRDGTWRRPPRRAELESCALTSAPGSIEPVAPEASGPAAADGDEEEEEAHGSELDAPVDLWWWLSFYHAGKRCGKAVGEAPPALLGWRQHPRQHTRTHGRLSIDNLRRIKVHFLLRRGGPLAGCTRVVVISVGATLRGWAADLRAHPAGGRVEVVEVSWAPGKKGNAPLPPAARLGAAAAGSKRKHAAAEGASAAVPAGRVGCERQLVMRVWAFGREEVRCKVREQVADLDEMVTDLFVA